MATNESQLGKEYEVAEEKQKHITSTVNYDEKNSHDSDIASLSGSDGFEDEDYDINDPRNWSTKYTDEHNPNGLRRPSKKEAATLRRILGRADYSVYLLCAAELAERASYYSVSGILSNFIEYPLPEGSTTGAPKLHSSSQTAGALDMGLSASSALTLLLTFLAYVVPLYGGFVADTQLGKFKSIWIGVFSGFIAHILLVIAGIPKVIAEGHAIVPTALGIITLAIGTGFIKPNLLPLLMDQYPEKTDVIKVLPSGESVIIDRQKSLERMALVFYWAINIGAFFQLATSYIERRIGFWFAFFIPIIVYLFLPVIFFVLQKKLVKEHPQGSVLTNTFKILRVSYRGNWIKRMREGTFWEYASPAKMAERGQIYYKTKTQSPITWNEQWVLDIKQTFNSCKIFIYFPIYNICDSGLGSVETSQAGSLTTKGVPNDLFGNFNPLTIIILIPILDYIIYPTLRRYKIDFKPSYRIAFGFLLAAASQAAGAIIQRRIYNTSACGDYATTCKTPSPISAWVDVTVYILSAASECFANVTAYELAYTRSPPHMKGLVMALFLFTSAISAAIGEAITPVMNDPHLVWVFGSFAIIGTASAILFFFHFRNLDKEMEYEREVRERFEQIDAHRYPDAVVNEANLEAVTSIKTAVGK
ncbi:PTR2-domain-containing protein [Suhomyces tanzawaensis NRRL Y-17324]|uniref:PTR2-domain-containing protein n=1 Tax=Suhomyces tanzawaensis NRRL Y-17324 TaxID=984487 RepID=A0A1E4SPB3_9ASCO|nr:PTR2-domain-containing protein [Suhomyces tanzawaensis NRRL Y-17324]ODV81222.1 PTR2-domain-containing protein [Suhomyces tanzawaensis NRRL Y-17324]